MAPLKKALILLAILPLGGCLRSVGVTSTSQVLGRGVRALHEESDPELARQSYGAHLKLLEMLLENAPRRRDLRALAAEGFAGYAYLFLEDAAPARARGFYLRGRDHALALLDRGLAGLPLDAFQERLAKTTKRDVPALFWAGFAWGGYVNV